MTRSQKSQITVDIQAAIRAEFDAQKSVAQNIVRQEIVIVLREIFGPLRKTVPPTKVVDSSDDLFGYSERSAERLRNVYLWLITINVVAIVLAALQLIIDA